MAPKKTKIIAGNWKMNPVSVAEAKEIFLGVKKIARNLKNVKTIIFPPFVYIELLNRLSSLGEIKLGAQDVFEASVASGSYTGEICGQMIKSVGANHVIIGHSERRASGETDAVVNQKILSALRSGLNVVLCIGEKDRDKEGHYFHFLKEQIRHSLVDVQKKYFGNIIIAYEPIWAIGKSDREAMNPRDLHEMYIFIKKNLIDHFKTQDASKVPILYGGSSSSLIAKDLLSEGGVDGLLVGRQSLDVVNFGNILKIANDLV